ncbi:MAG: hypothetical protein AAF725_18195, partial [Acidobacteriota bacterium]
MLWLAVLTAALVAPPALRGAWRSAALRGLALAPAWSLVAVWFVGFRQSGVDSRLFWGQMPWQRLHPNWLVESLFGGLKGGPTEPALAAAAVLWLAAGAWQARGKGPAPTAASGDRVDRGLLGLALGLGALAFALPAVYHHTILFAARWLAPALALAALAVPPPRLHPLLRSLVPLTLLALLTSDLARTWRAFEAEELRGFAQSLEALEASGAGREDRLLALDFARTSPRIDGFPFHHLPAYAQAMTGIELNRSFADDAASLVVFSPLPH